MGGRLDRNSKGLPLGGLVLKFGLGLCLHDLAGFNAGGADAHALWRSLHQGPHRTKIHIPATPSDVMGVADVIAKLRPFAAHFTYLRHCMTPEIDSEGLIIQVRTSERD